MALNETIFTILEENAIEGNDKLKPLVDAITNRNLITFYYTGPTKGKNRVKQGDRVKAEAVALGLTKKGNLAIRAYIPSPNTSRKGFKKTHWRTFLVDRMKRVAILAETFNTKREDYEDGPDGSFSTTYVTSDWSKEGFTHPPKVEKPTKIPKSRADLKKPPVKKVKPTTEPVSEPVSTELPQPSPETKPTSIEKPTTPIEKPIPVAEPEKVEPQPEELPQPKPETKPAANPEDDENKNLQESILRIKRLMFS